ncbi:MAG: ATP-binding cassette domain-containing protein [Actinomycetota bacterium]|nr:ATP-binding cassette domain-containing protein [Actinomycetota bacterium]
MTAPVVHLHEVSQRLSPRFTLHVPSLTVGPGITAVLGLNGCGKTTLLRLLATVCAPTTGTVAVGGQLVTDANLPAVRRRLGYLPQDDSVPRRLTVFDHVDLVAVMREVHSDTRRRRGAVHRALAEVELADLAGERCGRLSGGQRRRVALAAALAGDAELLVLDEPDAHLDSEQLDRLTATLRARAARATIVVATHDHAWAHQVADRTVHLAAGRVVG